MSSLCYLYGVVPAGTDVTRAPAGIDEKPVEILPAGAHAALLTRVSSNEYAPDKIEALAGNVEWVRSRAESHDRVLNWASDTARVIPLPMWTMFGDSAAVGAMLSARAPEFDSVLSRIGDAREYTVRVYVRSAELQSKVSGLSEEFRVLEAQAKSASPGQKYLLERKLDKERKETARRIVRQVANDIHAALSAKSKLAARDEITAGLAASDQGQAVLNASYLVPPGAMVDFQKTLTEFVTRYEPSGFTFAFTGPWPPYHFVGPAAGDDGGS